MFVEMRAIVLTDLKIIQMTKVDVDPRKAYFTISNANDLKTLFRSMFYQQFYVIKSLSTLLNRISIAIHSNQSMRKWKERKKK